MATAIPIIASLASIYSTVDGINRANRAEQQYNDAVAQAEAQKLTYDQASQRAQDVLNPIWDKNVNEAMAAMDRSQMARGFYGQLAGDALRGSRAADLESQRTGQIAQLSNQLVGQSVQNALAQQQLAAQWAANMGQQATNQFQTGLGGILQVGRDYGDQINLWMQNALKQTQARVDNAVAPVANPLPNTNINRYPSVTPGLDTLANPRNRSVVFQPGGSAAKTAWGNPFGNRY